jgi:hypothetical protein
MRHCDDWKIAVSLLLQLIARQILAEAKLNPTLKLTQSWGDRSRADVHGIEHRNDRIQEEDRSNRVSLELEFDIGRNESGFSHANSVNARRNVCHNGPAQPIGASDTMQVNHHDLGIANWTAGPAFGHTCNEGALRLRTDDRR